MTQKRLRSYQLQKCVLQGLKLGYYSRSILHSMSLVCSKLNASLYALLLLVSAVHAMHTPSGISLWDWHCNADGLHVQASSFVNLAMSLYSIIETPTFHEFSHHAVNGFQISILRVGWERKLGFQPQWLHGVIVAALWWQQWLQFKFTINVRPSYHLPHCNVYLFLCPNMVYLRLVFWKSLNTHTCWHCLLQWHLVRSLVVLHKQTGGRSQCTVLYVLTTYSGNRTLQTDHIWSWSVCIWDNHTRCTMSLVMDSCWFGCSVVYLWYQLIKEWVRGDGHRLSKFSHSMVECLCMFFFGFIIF